MSISSLQKLLLFESYVNDGKIIGGAASVSSVSVLLFGLQAPP